jgi:hypothetical protein
MRDWQALGSQAALAIPAPEHCLLLYALALPRRDKQVALFNGHVFAMLAMASAWVDAPARTKV